MEQRDEGEETWMVYEFMTLGSLQDLTIDYFRSDRRLQRTLLAATDSDAELKKGQLYNLCLRLGADLCETAKDFLSLAVFDD